MKARRQPPSNPPTTVASSPAEYVSLPTRSATPLQNVGGGVRKKSAGIRQWLLLDSAGQTQLVETEKHSVMRRTGLPARDLRILDPMLSYPSTVLGRERAIVINLEHIKAIITAHEVLMIHSKDPFVVSFVDELQRRLMRRHHSTTSQGGTTNSDDTDWASLYDLGDRQSKGFIGSPNVSNMSLEKSDEVKSNEIHSLGSQKGLKLNPFEFIALETCIEAACSSLEREARTLEKEAHPALDTLTTKISTLNLERVRQIKSRLVAISGRVQKVRDELENLLDDDEDMAEMYLTDKLLQQLESDSASSASEQDNVDEQVIQTDNGENKHERDIKRLTSQQERYFGSNAVERDSRMTRNGGVKHRDVEELEMLLEAYFVQIDGTLNKLSTLSEYVEDTEDYINIMLDDKQNHLLQMGVMLSTASLIINAFVIVVGAFGMNINIDLFNDDTEADKEIGMRKFMWTVCGCTTGSIFLYVVAIAWCKTQRLIE
ncbi:magnesium transporter MRS2-3-like [Rutidosis leptorrhynchoides]|uniref:magnesium transporter MRS2-3-like n=1 Tax=Rutidosis leptorrhynchoides TaxID=125765 RepID=UPI003A99EEBA